MRLDARLGALVVSVVLCAACCGADWITAPSYYTHDPQSGRRVDQYTPIGPFYTFARTDYLQSGYRHTRSTIQAGTSVDHMHIVEEWGRAVRPYGEWRFPYRPYSVPYAMWGPPFAGLGNSGAFGPWGAGRGGSGPGWEGDVDPYGRQQPPPYQDDRYPSHRSRSRDDGGSGPSGHPPRAETPRGDNEA
jgi:hypothetical protein